MSFQYGIVVQLSTRAKVDEFRAGLGRALNVVVLDIDERVFRRTAGIDALYLSLTRAEEWGASVQLPHTVRILPTAGADREAGMPNYVLTGLVLHESEPCDNAEFGFQVLARAIDEAIAGMNEQPDGSIRCIGFSESEVTFPSCSMRDSGEHFGNAFAVRGDDID